VTPRPAPGPRAGGLVHLILAGDARLDDRAAWRRGRSVLLAMDRKIAATPGLACQVRALQCRSTAGSRLRPAGRLARRHLKRSAGGADTGGADFARALRSVRTMMRHDLSALERSAQPVARPAVVLYAVDPPLADAVTAEEYRALAREALVTWVVPERSAALLSPVFAGGDARVVTDHQAVADEVVYCLPLL
jgi:hypothetical protein